MRIAVDFSAVRLTGPRVYTQGFLPALVRLLAPSDELTVFGPGDIAEIVAPLTSANIRFVGNPILRRVPARLFWQQLVLPGLLSSIGADVLFAPFDMGPWHGACPMVVGIRNPNPVILEGGVIPMTWKRRISGRIHKALVASACQRATLLIFPSRFAAAAVGGRLPGRPEKRRVVHHGLDMEFWAADGPAQPRGKYILFPSKFYAQKRAPLLLEAFADWRQRYRRTEYGLTFCGEELDSPRVQAMRNRIAELNLTDAVEMRGIVTRTELRALYRGAAVLALPTVLETFGFPYIEALASETPLVCADIEIARELCGDAPYYFRADDREDLADALEQALSEGPERTAKLAMGATRAKDFSWHREAEETLACLREAVSIG